MYNRAMRSNGSRAFNWIQPLPGSNSSWQRLGNPQIGFDIDMYRNIFRHAFNLNIKTCVAPLEKISTPRSFWQKHP